MAKTVTEFAEVILTDDERPTLQKREVAEDKHNNELTENMYGNLIPWNRVTRYNR